MAIPRTAKMGHGRARPRWTIDKKIMLEDRYALQNEESDVIRGPCTTRTCWLNDDAQNELNNWRK